MHAGVGFSPTPEYVHCHDCLVAVASADEELTLRTITCSGVLAVGCHDVSTDLHDVADFGCRDRRLLARREIGDGACGLSDAAVDDDGLAEFHGAHEHDEHDRQDERKLDGRDTLLVGRGSSGRGQVFEQREGVLTCATWELSGFAAEGHRCVPQLDG